MREKTMFAAVALMLALTMTACAGGKGAAETPPPSPTQTASVQEEPKNEEKTVHGIINRMNSYLVLLTDDGEYQVMDFGEGLNTDGFSEGDTVDITYTGELGSEEKTPVILSMTKAE